MTFALYVPDDYSEEAFEAGRLDYGGHVTPLEHWGIAENVVAGVRAHNQVVRSLAEASGAAFFVDQARLMPRGARFFDDACHLTPEGSERFVELLLVPVLAARGIAAGGLADPWREGAGAG